MQQSSQSIRGRDPTVRALLATGFLPALGRNMLYDTTRRRGFLGLLAKVSVHSPVMRCNL